MWFYLLLNDSRVKSNLSRRKLPESETSGCAAQPLDSGSLRINREVSHPSKWAWLGITGLWSWFGFYLITSIWMHVLLSCNAVILHHGKCNWDHTGHYGAALRLRSWVMCLRPRFLIRNLDHSDAPTITPAASSTSPRGTNQRGGGGVRQEGVSWPPR